MKKKVKIIILTAIGIGIFTIPIATKEYKYRKAKSLFEQNDKDEANEIFTNLGNYRDSEDYVNEYIYENAQNDLDQSDFISAYKSFEEINGYKDSDEMISQIENDHPLVTVFNMNAGDTFVYGSYEQDGNESDGKEPVEWILISNSNNRAYAISKYVLDVHEFNNIGTKWSASIYDWMDSYLKNNLFTEDEQKDLSRICLLKMSETETSDDGTEALCNIDLATEFTKYAASKNPDTDWKGNTMWWVERECSSPGYCLGMSDDVYSANVVPTQSSSFGNTGSDVTSKNGVRPTIWLFANQNDLPLETAYTGETVDHYRNGESSSTTSHSKRKCQYCHGTGFQTYCDYAGTIYEDCRLVICPRCNGDGYY